MAIKKIILNQNARMSGEARSQHVRQYVGFPRYSGHF
jgi:hypothetical protein